MSDPINVRALGVGTRPVGTAAEAASAIRTATREGKGVALRVLRDGQARFVPVPGPAQG